jgi:hypothetical protein
MARSIEVRVLSDATGYSSGMSKAKDDTAAFGAETETTAGKVEESEGKFSGAAKHIGEAIVAAFAVEKVVEFGKTLVDATVAAPSGPAKTSSTSASAGSSNCHSTTAPMLSRRCRARSRRH